MMFLSRIPWTDSHLYAYKEHLTAVILLDYFFLIQLEVNFLNYAIWSGLDMLDGHARVVTPR
jgi:hypothetical protein